MELEFSYLTALYVGDAVYGFVENGWLRLQGSQALPRCPWSEGRVYGRDSVVMRCNAKNWIPQLKKFTPPIAAGVTSGASSHACARFGGLHYGGSDNSDNAKSQSKADASSSSDLTASQALASVVTQDVGVGT